jgi:hypothetical protein
MDETAARLEQGAAILNGLTRRREETATPHLGVDREFEIIMRELCELEADILRDPGPLAHLFVRTRRRGKRISGEDQQ